MPNDAQAAVDRLVALLDLEPIEKDIFRGANPPTTPLQWVFGGQVAAQALMAAGRTVEPDRAVHSLHAYFIRRGDNAIPIVFTVDRIRDGRSFTTRRVVAVQHGEAIFAMSASFQLPQAGVDTQAAMPTGPAPEQLPPADTPNAETSEFERRLRSTWPFEQRRAPVGDLPSDRRRRLMWMRATGRLPDDPLLHACVFTYASDLTPIGTILEVNNIDRSQHNVSTASLDHSVWFHRPARVDEWLLHESESPSASGGRGLAISRVFTEDGKQAATTTQEGMIRVREI